VIDFVKVKPREKTDAYRLYSLGKKGLPLEDEKGKEKKSKSFVPGEPDAAEVAAQKSRQSEQIRAAIQKAKTMEEVQALERSLLEGKVPSTTPADSDGMQQD